MLGRFTKKSPFARVVTAALEEARRRGDRRVGTEHLLLGLLAEPAAEPARALGAGLDDARAALDGMDSEALEAIGVHVADLPASAGPRRHPALSVGTLTTAARATVHRAVGASPTGSRDLAPRHLLTALLDLERPDPAAELIERLRIDRAAARRLL
ncbi:Clp protease N-terminal domain-containing protein [Microbispora sp. NBC_01389]|uniref:Clp protease N-terminal domain-containing protein n=1 Tax=Microbispora sp. NBC_01389 TaxID=2903584 RepID=UPI00324B1927